MQIEKQTFDFLKALKKNNNREWFTAHKNEYESARQNFESFVDYLLKQLISFDQQLTTLEARKCMFRIYRDVRFSKNKDPYKNNFSAAINTQPKGNGFGFYIQIGPGVSFMGGGAWQPEAIHLKKIRQEIDYNGDAFIKLVNDKKFKTQFTQLMQDHKLVNPPKGYDKTHPQIEFLKLNSFVAGTNFDDPEVLQPSFAKSIINGYKTIHPFINFLNTAIS